MNDLNRLAHSNVGRLIYRGTERVVGALCTSYVGYDKKPLLFSFTGTQELVKSLRSSIGDGEALQLERKSYPYGIPIDPAKQKFRIVGQKTLPMTGELHTVIANQLLYSGQTYEEKRIFVPVLDSTNPAPEVFARLTKIIGSPLFPEWMPILWVLAKTLKLVEPVTHQYGMTVWTTQVDDQWKDLIASAQQGGTVKKITEIYNERMNNGVTR